MTAHELAKKLLEGPDVTVVMESNGYDSDAQPEVESLKEVQWCTKCISSFKSSYTACRENHDIVSAILLDED